MNTNHKPLTYVMTSAIERPSLRQTRHLAYIAEFTTDIRYVEGETNGVADALSRTSVSLICSDSLVDYKNLSENQALDSEFIRLRHLTSSTLNFQLLKSVDDNLIGVTCLPETLDHTLQKHYERKCSRVYMD